MEIIQYEYETLEIFDHTSASILKIVIIMTVLCILNQPYYSDNITYGRVSETTSITEPMGCIICLNYCILNIC